MEYNDIETRLKRIYASIDKKNKYGVDVLTGMQSDIKETSDGKFTLSITFGNETDNENHIVSIISNLANLKDILKNCMELRGKNKELIEKEIDNSFPLQLILDLNNQEKHGKLTKTQRSKKDPMIVNIRSAIGVSDKPDNIHYAASDGSAAFNVMISINADVIDSNKNHLLTLDELINQAIQDWEKIITTFQIA